MKQLYCGAGKACITPPEELLPDLRGLQDRHFGGVLDDLYVRVIAWENREEDQIVSAAAAETDGFSGAVSVSTAKCCGDGDQSAKLRPELFLFVCFELDKVPQDARYNAILAEAVGAPEENITLTAVHTHSAPISGYRPFEGPNFIDRKPQEVREATAKFQDLVADKLREAALQAVGSMVPARMGVATAQSYINIDRKQWYEYTDESGLQHRKLALGRNAASQVDRTATILRFNGLDGREIAMLVHYPVHCCVLHTNRCCDGKLGISPDIGGAVSRMLEESHPGTVALWCSGAAGDINPVMQNELYYPDPKTGDVVTFEIPGGDCRYLVTMLAAQHYDDIRRSLSETVWKDGDINIGGIVEWSETEGIAEPYQVRLHMLRIGDVYILGGSGEFYSSYARTLRHLLPEPYALLLNHESSLACNSGYILDTLAASADEIDLPGTQHLNIRPGLFEPDFAAHAMHMYRALR